MKFNSEFHKIHKTIYTVIPFKTIEEQHPIIKNNPIFIKF